jgi:hypothetical protein
MVRPSEPIRAALDRDPEHAIRRHILYIDIDMPLDIVKGSGRAGTPLKDFNRGDAELQKLIAFIVGCLRDIRGIQELMHRGAEFTTVHQVLWSET